MITILSGAGASYAINQDKYPTTVKFAERLPDTIKQNDIFKLFHTYLEKKYEGKPLDIELYLWEMRRSNDIFSELINQGSILGQAFGHAFQHLKGDLRKRQLDSNRVENDLRQFADRLHDLQKKMNQKVFDFYAQPTNEEEISSNWLHLLNSLYVTEKNIAFHTLNYDLIPESITSCLKSKMNIFDGKISYPLVRIDSTFWSEKKYLQEANHNLSITKLHGSIDWRKVADGGINFGNEEYSGNLEKHLLLYPGYEKTNHEEPYKSFYEYFEYCLRSSDKIIVVGYAFRDEGVNMLLREALRESKDTKLFIIDITSQIDHGLPDSQVTIFTGNDSGFGTEAIDALLSEIKK